MGWLVSKVTGLVNSALAPRWSDARRILNEAISDLDNAEPLPDDRIVLSGLQPRRRARQEVRGALVSDGGQSPVSGGRSNVRTARNSTPDGCGCLATLLTSRFLDNSKSAILIGHESKNPIRNRNRLSPMSYD